MTRHPGHSRPASTVAAPQQPAAMLRDRGHVIVHVNRAFAAEFGDGCLGLPAAEALPDLPPAAFALMDLAFREARAVACPVVVGGAARRLVLGPQRDIETGEVYGLRFHLVAAAAREAQGGG